MDALSDALAAARSVGQASRRQARLSDLLAGLGRRGDAVAELERARALPPGSAEDHEALAFSAFGLGEHALAQRFYADVVELAPRDATAWYNLATAERNIGRLDVAETAANRALDLDPQLVQAALLRSNLRTQQADRNHVDELRRRLAELAGAPAARIFLNYALGKELDDLGAYDEAFAHFGQGARARRASLDYEVDEDVRKLGRIQAAFCAERLGRAAVRPLGASCYGFVLGLPRSGTTLIERVLTGHPAVRSNGETDNVLGALMEGVTDTGADIFERAARADPARVAAGYARRAGVPASGRVVLEKLPLNYLYAGAIRRALPDAPIIVVTRSPADNLFAMYSTLFGSGYPFSYDLGELVRYHAAYRDLTAHWKRTLGDQLMEVSYEAFIAAPDNVGPRIAAHVGVDWRSEMVRVEENRTASATASAAQVRQPIYGKSVGRWRNYARHLTLMLQALEADGVDLEA